MATERIDQQLEGDMNWEKWSQIKAIFADAEDLEPVEREDFVRKAAGGDAELEAEIMSLLGSRDVTGNILEANAFDLTRKLFEETSPKAGRTFGNYRIVSELGRGGMGSVFLVERIDGEFKQNAALKVIRNTVADAETERRFRMEREILATLHHPNIAQLYDGGLSDNGEPFFVMEHVEGLTLSEYVRTANSPLNERLGLFLKICSAVDYAHRNLTVHRDLKPSNILITPDGEPKLLDFGLAKLLDEQGGEKDQTETMFRAFTPAYASPEQILGKRVTIASDIYSLGVILYELLTDSKPFVFDGMSLEEIVRTITASDPVRPSSVGQKGSSSAVLRPSVASDLDTIAMKCLEKEPERRYATAADLAADIQRFLDGMPILARPSTFSYRASKFVRRNWKSVAAGTLAAVSLITGLGVSIWQAEVARAERDRAEQRFQDVRKLSNSLLFEITPKIETLEGSTEAREILVKRALEYLDSLAAEAAGDNELQKELAAAYEKIGELQGHPSKPNLGDLAGSLSSYEKANAIRLAQPETPENLKLLAENFRHLSDARYWQGDTQGTLAALERSKQIYEELLNSQPGEVSFRLAYLRILTELSQYHQANNQYPEAILYAEKAIAGTADLYADARETREVFFVTHADLGNSLSWNGEQERAEAMMAVAVGGMEKLLSEKPNDARTRHLMWRVYMLASGIFEEISNERSLEFAEKARGTAQKGVEIDPADIQFRYNLARTNYRVAVAAANLKRSDEALNTLKVAETQFLALIQREPRNRFYRTDLGRIYTRAGLARRLTNDLAGSNADLFRSIEIWRQVAEADPGNKNARRDIALSHRYLAENLIKLGEKVQAREHYRLAVDMLNRLKNENSLPEVDLKLIAELETVMAKL
ncbi:serine/threonine-protein kinase [Leptolyngbya sp. 7M]|uniref:serine/threonine-protein kinase n=1 Tax=Leptolyngbya sp. 7M TaxID=2812896 RepID=UPI001B8C659A|nr:serine/threonine-protein kinase [Leptolyngbya sp. 7M]QYO65311.1 protein kinase [Leptolyngbya sp. 7M]